MSSSAAAERSRLHRPRAHAPTAAAQRPAPSAQRREVSAIDCSAMPSPKKIVLAYSGGLDTSVILPWLKERYPGVRLVAFAAELGQGSELKGIERKAKKSGADEVVVRDLRREFAEDYCFPMLRAHATYESDYLLGTSIARPLIAKAQVDVAHETGADAVAHGATGKGNDQVRFELTCMALDPSLHDHLAVERPPFPGRWPERPRDSRRLCRAAQDSDHADEGEALLAGSQPVAHLARGRRDRGSLRGTSRARLHDQPTRQRGARQGGIRRDRVQEWQPGGRERHALRPRGARAHRRAQHHGR